MMVNNIKIIAPYCMHAIKQNEYIITALHACDANIWQRRIVNYPTDALDLHKIGKNNTTHVIWEIFL